MINIKRGLDLPIAGAPQQTISDARPVRTVAVLGGDYVGMKPTMAVREGDRVKLGQLLFSDKKAPGIRYTSPAGGVVKSIQRGERRVLLSVEIEVDGDEAETFEQWMPEQLAELSEAQIRQQLIASGLWTAFRTRPYSKVPEVDAKATAIFVTAIDTHPLAADPAVIIQSDSEAFAQGLSLLNRLSDGTTHLCQAPGVQLPTADAEVTEFSGPHPAGLAGTHIHFLEPVGAHKTVWTIGYQDVIAIGKLFTTGKLNVERVIALGGPQVKQPRLLRTRVGAALSELCEEELKEGDNRLISGSVFSGHKAQGAVAYLGRYHQQVSVLCEGRERELLGWLSPGVDRFSLMNIYLSKFNPKRLFNFTCTTNGSARAIVPVGNYEKVMPLDILPVHLLRALVVGDTETAQKLGALELDEEDLALCTFACSGKYEYGPILRDNLSRIEKEG